MIKKLILNGLLLASMVQSLVAANVGTRSEHQLGEKILVTFHNMEAKNRDWIGIYSQGASNDWENVIAWKWTGDTTDGSIIFDSLPWGRYEVRAFYNNSFHTEATTRFKIGHGGGDAQLNTIKNDYTPNEKIEIEFYHLTDVDQSWIGIYPKGSSNDWSNVVKWTWTGDKTYGTFKVGSLPVGEYSARLFYHNSFKDMARKIFKVQIDNHSPQLATNQDFYAPNEQIKIDFRNMKAKHQDWIGIYPRESNNDWKNVVAWKWTGDKERGTLNFGTLPLGDYEIRAFYNNSFTTVATYPLWVFVE